MKYDPGQDFEPKKLGKEMFDKMFFFSKVGLIEIAVKAGCIDKPRPPKNELFLKKLKIC